MRLQAAFDVAARAAVLGAAAAAVIVYLFKLRLVGSRSMIAGLAAIVAAVLVAALWRAMRPIALERAAKRIDASHGLHDRLGSALAFSAEPAPTPFMQAALEDAARVAGSVDARKAAPFSRPRALGPAAIFSTAAVIVALLRFPAGGAVVAPVVAEVPRLSVDPDVLEPEREAIAQLAADAADDPDAKKLADQLNQLLDQVDQRELTRKEAFDKLAEIEKQMKAEDGDFEQLKRDLKKAGDELNKSKLTREAGQALQKEDLQKAREELEKLAAEAEKLAKEKKDDAKREELAKALERAADEQQKDQKSAEEKKLESEEQKLKEEQRRLKREQEQNPNDQELARRLKRNQRELERLEREKQKMAEQKRELQRLQRELQKAAEQLRQKLSPEAAEALRQAAQQMKQMEQEIKKLGNSKRTQMQIAELKEMLRRAGGSQGKSGQPSDGPGPMLGRQRNQGNGKGQMLRDFNDRAGGQKVLTLGQNPGEQKGPMVLLPIPLPGEQQPGPGKEPGQGMPGQPGGDGIGNQHDPNVMGDPTKMKAQHQMSRVQGQEGAGESRSETILGSAEKGFSGRAYKKVYSDYTSVVEEVMSKERVPPGYRYYVKRYFQLIKPR